MSGDGGRLLHTAGRSGRPNNRQRSDSSSCRHRTLAGLPLGIPGMGDEIEGAMQQAAQPERQTGNPSIMDHLLAINREYAGVHYADKSNLN